MIGLTQLVGVDYKLIMDIPKETTALRRQLEKAISSDVRTNHYPDRQFASYNTKLSYRFSLHFSKHQNHVRVGDLG